ncbi:MAG: transcription elongation factor GreA [Acidimicrobiia bacterium]
MIEPEPTWLTPAAHQRLTDELEELTMSGRVEITERIAEARSHGDLRENADYDAAKNEQGLMEARIRKIQHLLQTAEIKEPSDGDTVEIGSVVTVRREDGGETDVFVAPPENKVDEYMLASPSSPLGGALLGARVGDKVGYEAPGGTFTVEVISLRPFDR